MSDSVQSAERTAREPEGAARVKTVLVVDDVESERTAIRTAIESRTKFRVCGEASNGVEAIRQANELRPDLVLMDLAMPQMNGLEAAKVLRITMPTVPVVLLTLHADLIGPRSSVLGVMFSPKTTVWPHCFAALNGCLAENRKKKTSLGRYLRSLAINALRRFWSSLPIAANFNPSPRDFTCRTRASAPIGPSWTRKSSLTDAPTALDFAVSTNRPPRLKSRTLDVSLRPLKRQRTQTSTRVSTREKNLRGYEGFCIRTAP